MFLAALAVITTAWLAAIIVVPFFVKGSRGKYLRTLLIFYGTIIVAGGLVVVPAPVWKTVVNFLVAGLIASQWRWLWMKILAYRIFGCDISEGEGGWFSLVVPDTLARLAEDFNRACWYEEYFRRVLLPIRAPMMNPAGDIIYNVPSDKEVKAITAEAKRVFWRAHKVADYFGHPVGKSYKDHLPTT